MLSRFRHRPTTKFLSLLPGIVLCLSGGSRVGCAGGLPHDCCAAHEHVVSPCSCKREKGEFGYESLSSLEITVKALCRLMRPCDCDTNCECLGEHSPSPGILVPSSSLCQAESLAASPFCVVDLRATACIHPTFHLIDNRGFPLGALACCIFMSRLLL